METPSCDDGSETTDSAVLPDETWRTLRSIHRRDRVLSSPGSDAFIASQLMTEAGAHAALGGILRTAPSAQSRADESLRTHLPAANSPCPSPASPANPAQSRIEPLPRRW